MVRAGPEGVDEQGLGQSPATLVPAGGSELTIYGTNDPRPQSFEEGWTELDGPKTATGTARFDLDGSYQYLLVWFSSLPQDEGGKYRGGIASVNLRS